MPGKLLSLFFPNAMLFGTGLFLCLSSWQQHAVWWRYIPYIPWFLTLAGIVFGLRFGRSKVVLALFLIMTAYFASTRLPGLLSFNNVQEDAFVAFLQLYLPVNLLLLYLFQERGVFTWRGILLVSFLTAQPAAAIIALMQNHPLTRFTTYSFIPRHILDLPLSQPAMIVYLVVMAFFLLRALIRKNSISTGFFWSAAALGTAQLLHDEAKSTFFFSLALFCLILAVIENAYGMAYRDELTGLPGRRALNQHLKKLGGTYSIAMVDIDFFKKFNDRYGHDVGDQALCKVAGQLARVGGGGKAYRYGGEEFTIVFAKKSKEQAIPHLEVLRSSIASSGFVLRSLFRPKKKPAGKPRRKKTRKIQLSVSIGVAQTDEKNRKPAEVIKAADKALYKSKKNGRNRVSV